MGYIGYVDESLSLDVHKCKMMSKQIRLSAFFGQQHKEETAEMSTEHNDEAEPENDQSSEPKTKLLKCNFQQSWQEKYKTIAEVQSTKGYVLFALPKIKSHINLA